MQCLLDIASADPYCKVALGTDNTAAMFALRAGHSGNGYADRMLHKFYYSLPSTFSFKVFHVDTALNRADPFTRGLQATMYQGDGRRARQRIPLIRQALQTPMHCY